MKNVWKKIMEYLAIAINKPDIPPVIGGARGLIQRLCEEEAKIETSSVKKMVRNGMTIPCESIATIVHKYGNRDIYRDVYQFIEV